MAAYHLLAQLNIILRGQQVSLTVSIPCALLNRPTLTHPHTQTCCQLVAHRHTLSVHSQTHCHPILHYQTCLLNLALSPRAYLFLHALSGLLPMFSQTCCLGILRLTFYVFSGSLPIYLFIGLLPILSQDRYLCILSLAVYLVSGSLPMYSQVAVYLVSGSLPMYS